MTWEEATQRYVDFIQPRQQTASVDNFRRALDQFRKVVAVPTPAQLRGSHLRQYQLFLQNRVQVGTLLARFYALIPFFRWLFRDLSVLEDPTRDLELPKSPKTHQRILSQSEVLQLLALGGSRLVERRDQSLIEFIYGTGLRGGEAVNVAVEDVDLGQNQLLVRRGKGGQSRWVPLGNWLKQILSSYLQEVRPRLLRARSESALWLTRTGRPLTLKGLQSAIHSLAVRAALPWVCPHSLRHAYATHLLEGGASLNHIQKLLGHSTLKSTEIYTHLMPVELLREYRRTHPRARQKTHLAKLH